MRRSAVCLLLLASPPLAAEEVSQRFGQLTVAVDTTYAQPGGVAIVRFRSLRYLGSTFAIFGGRRAPVFAAPPGPPRALVPIPVDTPAGPGLLGIELYARTGVQRAQMTFPIAERGFGARSQTLAEDKRALLHQPHAMRDGRRLLMALRVVSDAAQWQGPFQPPVLVPALDTFGEHETYVGGSPVEMMMDGGLGDQHRGIDYAVASGYVLQAPAGGTVVMAEPLLLTGNTLVIDHGQGLVSLLCHLSQLDVKAGERVAPRQRVGLAGDSGLATFAHAHWGVYLHGIPVDPNVVTRLFEQETRR